MELFVNKTKITNDNIIVRLPPIKKYSRGIGKSYLSPKPLAKAAVGLIIHTESINNAKRIFLLITQSPKDILQVMQ